MRATFFFSRYPISSKTEAVTIKENEQLISVLLAAGFIQNNTEFIPTTCPLGTFTNISTKGADRCQNCTPGNF